MEKEFKEELKQELENRKEELEEILSSFSGKDPTVKGNWKTEFPEFGGSNFRKDEESDAVEEYNNLLPAEHRLELKLLDMKRALEKINRGENFGICEKCGKSISQERLKVIPEAKFCYSCAKQ